MDRERHDVFAELFVRNENRVYRYILTLVPNAADADELFQQTGLTIWKRWEEFDPARDFSRWACGIAHNLVRNFVRKHERRQVALSPELLDAIGALRLEREELLEERREALGACLDKLPPDQRNLLEDFYLGDRNAGERAGRQGRTPNLLYKILRKIRRVLHDCITLSLESGRPS